MRDEHVDLTEEDIRFAFGPSKVDLTNDDSEHDLPRRSVIRLVQDWTKVTYPALPLGSCSLFSNWVGSDPQILQASTEPVYLPDLESLNDQNFLTDGVINWYMHLLCISRPQVYFFSSLVYSNILHERQLATNVNDYQTFLRYGKGVLLSKCNRVFFPINQPLHWCLAVAYPNDLRLSYYDPMGGQDNLCLQLLEGFLQARGRAYQSESYLNTNWTHEFVGPYTSPRNIPGQTDGHSCGLFCCALADELSALGPDFSWPSSWGYSQADMVPFRKLVRCLMMAYE